MPVKPFGQFQVQALGQQVQFDQAGKGGQQVVGQPLHHFREYTVDVVIAAGHAGRGVEVGQQEFQAGVIAGVAVQVLVGSFQALGLPVGNPAGVVQQRAGSFQLPEIVVLKQQALEPVGVF